MSRTLVDLTGQQFGRLRVLHRIASLSGATRWRTACACGNWKDVRAGSLLDGSTRSCGCLRPRPSPEARARARRERLDSSLDRFVAGFDTPGDPDPEPIDLEAETGLVLRRRD